MQLFAVMAQLVSLCSCMFTLSVTYLLFKSVESELFLDDSELVDDRTYDEWFQSGMTAYNNEEWYNTIWYFENGIKEFKYYRSSLAYCRIKCQNASKIAVNNDGLNEQRYFQAIFKKALCIRKCKAEKLGSRPERINQEVTDKYLSQTPYSYLQFAYYKNMDYEKAVAAAFTYVQANPDDDVMYNNLDYYKNLHGISEDHLVDLEEKLHNRNFLDAYSSYERSNYTGVIVNMEMALKNYWMAEEECRAMCEGKYENREFMDLYEAIANHYASTLFCKDQCETWLATIKGKVLDDYLPNHFHFLQFAYYQVDDMEAAVSAAAAFLLLKPGDATMESNMAYYEVQQGVNKYTIRPRSDAQAYKERLDLETQMLEFAKNEFWGEEDEEFLEEVMSTIKKDLLYLEAEPIKSSEFLKEVMSTLKEDIQYEEAEPIKAFEVNLLTDKGDFYDYIIEEEDMPNQEKMEHTEAEERYPGELDLEDDEKEDGLRDDTVVEVSAKKFGGPMVVTPDVVDDTWDEDEALPLVEYADGGWSVEEDLHGNHDDDDEMTEEEKRIDEIELEKFLNEEDEEDGDDTHEDDTGDDDDEEIEEDDDDEDDDNDDDDEDDDDEDEEEEEGDAQEELEIDSNNDDKNNHDNKDETVKSDDEANHDTPNTVAPLDQNAKDTKDYRKAKQRTSDDKITPRSPQSIDHDDSDPAAKYRHPDSSQSEPSGPAKSGPTVSIRKTRVTPQEGDLDDFVQAPTDPIQILHNAAELNGTNRVAADGIASQEECETLMKLIKMEALGGDGYQGASYVHTKFELFEGLTVKQATQAAKSGRVSLFYPLTYMHVAERSRQFVEEYFNLAEKGLWFSYTHLVCRTAEPDSTNKRTDLSHPIHADNCNLDPYGNCHKQRPAFVWRDWSAITYLNADFEGGEFIFAHANQTVQATLKPKCGRIVGFSAGKENLHGVKGVISGTRCALALWFTHDSRYRELDFLSSAEVVSEMYESVYGNEKHDEL